MKKVVFIIALFACLWLGIIATPPSFALDVHPGQSVELKQRNRLGIPLHRESRASLIGRIPDGTVAKVLSTDDAQHWIQVDLPDSRQGWIVERYVDKVLGTPGNGGPVTDPNGSKLKLAAWNIKHLRDENGEGPAARQNSDFQKLKDIATDLNADIIALQEVENKAAARRVFDSSIYNFFITEPQPGNTFPQMTGFAVRKTIDVQPNPEFDELQLNNPNLRSGTDITVGSGNKTLRLLSIHLKSSCFEGDLGNPSNRDCKKLAKQVPILEQWIDERANENIPFIVLGDWNRRMDDFDDIWKEIDDATPTNANLLRIPPKGVNQDCWNFDEFIDFFALDKRAEQLFVPNSFKGLRIEPDTSRSRNTKLSDHCPISIELKI